MKIKQVTSVYAVEENGDLSYRRSLDGWDKKDVLAFDAVFINELEIGDEAYSIDEAYNLIVDKLFEIHALVEKIGIDDDLLRMMRSLLMAIKDTINRQRYK